MSSQHVELATIEQTNDQLYDFLDIVSTSNPCSDDLDKIVNTVKKYPALVNSSSVLGITPLIHACSKSNISFDVVALLIKLGANVNYQDEDGWSPLFYAGAFSKDGSNLEVINLLLDNGADIYLKSNDGRTAYMVATGNIELPAVNSHVSSLVNDSYLLDCLAELEQDDGYDPLEEYFSY